MRVARAPSDTVLQAVTTSAPETCRLGAALARVLRPGDVVLLCGELGAGKTTLVQGLAGALGVEEQVTSPTFTLVRPYACGAPRSAQNPTALRVLLHADLYRLERSRELADLALGELVEEEAAAVVEWGEVADAELADQAFRVELSVDDDEPERRQVTVVFPPGRQGDAGELRAALAGAGSG